MIYTLYDNALKLLFTLYKAMYPVSSIQLSLMLRSIQVALKSGKGDVMERERERIYVKHQV